MFDVMSLTRSYRRCFNGAWKRSRPPSNGPTFGSSP